jgi:hypothetical protein
MRLFNLFVTISIAATASAHAKVTFSKDVAPIFYKNCVMCHRPGEVAPMSLLTHKEARPWAKSIAKQIQQGTMPPWSGESDRHTFSNDLSLTQEESDTILQWVREGTPAGSPDDLPKPPTFPESWILGEPDYVLTMSEVEVPADGEDLFLKETLTFESDEPRWIQAIEFLPGDRRVTHHFQSTYSGGLSDGVGSQSAQGAGVLAIWTAGMNPFVFPEGMGRVMQPGAQILIDSHYHPVGEATTDQTRIGLHFGEGELKKEMFTLVAANTGIRIPSGAEHHAELAYHLFDRDMQIYAFSPHMHVRGKAMKYELTHPDGTKETLLDVPKYNYSWQWQYYPDEPIDVAKGSRLDVTAVWDNSENNPANPDPSQEIIYRGDTFNEMFVGFFEVAESNSVRQTPPPPDQTLKALLSNHPEEDCYMFKGFLPFGIYAPQDGEGWLYLANGSSMFTISLDDLAWDGDKLHIATELPTPEASATTSTLDLQRDDQGRLKGTLHYGIDSPRPIKMPCMGQPLAAAG